MLNIQLWTLYFGLICFYCELSYPAMVESLISLYHNFYIALYTKTNYSSSDLKKHTHNTLHVGELHTVFKKHRMHSIIPHG